MLFVKMMSFLSSARAGGCAVSPDDAPRDLTSDRELAGYRPHMSAPLHVAALCLALQAHMLALELKPHFHHYWTAP
jgi:hypothetical protein